ncbi:MAG: TetR/AcrR family transcriptional regulator [Deltaproteobacteria bacterium]|nr:TetR/AcrR family transcriptional regulator [Deltaproteobacteria bacterium]
MRRGIEAVTIDEVAREAGMAKGNFYRYFRDKADLVEAVIEPVARTTRQAVQECDEKLRTADGRDDAVAAYGQLGNRLVGALAMHPDAMCLYLQERRAPATTARQAISDLARSPPRRCREPARERPCRARGCGGARTGFRA